MSTPVIAVVGGLLAFYGLLGVCLWRRERRRPLERDQIIREARARVWDADGQRWSTEPGINLADLDACELILDDPAFAARCKRLWDAVRDEQQNQKGD
jgi:hypothetical protein